MASPKQASRTGKDTPKVDKQAPFFFLHGDDESAIERFKMEIVTTHLSHEEREENYLEIIPSSGRGSLRNVLGDLVAELSTVSFLPGVKRIVTLYPVADFFEAGASKARSAKAKAATTATVPPKRSASDHLAEFIEKDLPELPAVLICLAFEDYEKWKRISTANPVVAAAQSRSALYAFKEPGLQFVFFDALFARRTDEALDLWRAWLDRTDGGPKAYQQRAMQVRLLLQAKTAASNQLKARGVSVQRFASEFMPAERDKNFFALQPEWRQDKLRRFSNNFALGELLAAYEKLDEIQKYAIPLNSDPYVPDKALLTELWIIEFTAGRQ